MSWIAPRSHAPAWECIQWRISHSWYGFTHRTGTSPRGIVGTRNVENLPQMERDPEQDDLFGDGA